jgi:hypothetical protein
MRWLGNPQANKKDHGSIIMSLLNKEVAKKIEKGGLFFKGLFFKGALIRNPRCSVFNAWKLAILHKFARRCRFATSVAMNITPVTVTLTFRLNRASSVLNMKKKPTQELRLKKTTPVSFTHP